LGARHILWLKEFLTDDDVPSRFEGANARLECSNGFWDFWQYGNQHDHIRNLLKLEFADINGQKFNVGQIRGFGSSVIHISRLEVLGNQFGATFGEGSSEQS
jgi:hypothetical protein